jgi:HK97 family phage portal protein
MIISDGKALGFAPQALGETVPNIANGYFYANQGLGLLGQFATYAAMYKGQPSISTVVDKVGNSLARLPVKVWDPSPSQGNVEDKTSPYAKLMASPSTEMSSFRFWRWTICTYEIYGEAFWYKQRRDIKIDALGNRIQSGPVVNLLPMHPSRTAVHRDVEGNVEYVFTLGVASAGILHAPAEDVVAFMRYNPDLLMRGLSRLESLRTTLLNEDAARRANESWWTRGGRPSIILNHPGKLSQPAMDGLKASFDARHAGADRMGGSAVLQEGMTAQMVQLNAEEMQYIESRKFNLQEVCMVYDMPPNSIHILDHATFSNITEQFRSVYRDTMTPRAGDLESAIDHDLRPEFFGDGERLAQFDMSDVLRGDYETRVDKGLAGRQAGLWSGNTALELIGLPKSDDPEMDKIYANAALVPLGKPAQRVSITEAATPDPAMSAEANATATEAQAAAADAAQSDAAKSVRFRDVLGKAGRVKADKAAIRATLVTEHQKALSKFFDAQHAAVKSRASRKAAGVFDPSAWDGNLSSILHTLSRATAQAIGAKVAADLGGEYSGADIAAYLQSNSDATAKKINQTTADQIAAAMENADDSEDDGDTIDGLFGGEIAARSNQISLSRVAMVAGLAALVAARQSNASTKTWVVTSGKPRSSHANMNGETVPLGQPFSNGMDGPGDYSGGADEVAGCTCDMDFSKEG